MKTKTCKGINSICKDKVQPVENFSFAGGCYRRRETCKECHNAMQRRKRAEKPKTRKRRVKSDDVFVFGEAAQTLFARRLVA